MKDSFETDNFFDYAITEEKLIKRIRKNQKLEDCESIKIKVDTTKLTLDHLGELMPSLKHLYLSNSNIVNIRDCGTNLQQLETLFVDNCNMIDISGISVIFPNLIHLNVDNNNLSDIGDVSDLFRLETFSCQNNPINDDDMFFFTPLASLTDLNLLNCMVDHAKVKDIFENLHSYNGNTLNKPGAFNPSTRSPVVSPKNPKQFLMNLAENDDDSTFNPPAPEIPPLPNTPIFHRRRAQSQTLIRSSSRLDDSDSDNDESDPLPPSPSIESRPRPFSNPATPGSSLRRRTPSIVTPKIVNSPHISTPLYQRKLFDDSRPCTPREAVDRARKDRMKTNDFI
eukprot:TRINITY_DN1169_c0_g1_i1.p1 TRINITY_DN1169_c0_g1~~TRINITY_DN1169_c0_g1_i1.p1  ORF type:complete len:339 (+),score=97.61 TRINITY_DN1169_c0_g1_i1:50-1066(+)